MGGSLGGNASSECDFLNCGILVERIVSSTMLGRAPRWDDGDVRLVVLRPRVATKRGDVRA